MKLFRIAALIVLFLSGTACLVWYFRTGKDENDSEKEPDSGMLLTDISPLGDLSVLSDGALTAGNARGEVKFFRPGKPEQTVSVSQTSISAPVAEFDGVCYVGDEAGTFAAFTPERGVLWTFRAGNQITGGAVRDSDGLVWFGSHDRSLYALDASGKLVHEVECQGQINGSPVFDGSFLYLGSCDGKLRKIDIHTGEVVNELDFESYIPETPVLSGGVLYVLTHGGELAAVGADDFEVLFRVKTEYTFFTSPFVTESYIFLTDSNGTIHVHKRADGAFLADLPSGEPLNPVCAGSDNGIYTISRRGVLSFFKGGTWREYGIAAFLSDFRSGVIESGDDLLVAADEYGNVFYTFRATVFEKEESEP
jgi:outer membrane protein assembly factor BamB